MTVLAVSGAMILLVAMKEMTPSMEEQEIIFTYLAKEMDKIPSTLTVTVQ
jgi:uncharacterized membrane protein